MSNLAHHDSPALHIFAHLSEACDLLVQTTMSDTAGEATLQGHAILADIETGFEMLAEAPAETAIDAQVFSEMAALQFREGLLALANGKADDLVLETLKSAWTYLEQCRRALKVVTCVDLGKPLKSASPNAVTVN